MERELLAECYRVLSPKGRIVGYDPNALCVQNMLFMNDNFLRLSVFSPDERPIKPLLLKEYTSEAGFVDFKKNLFSFQNKKITLFEFAQRYLIKPFSHGPLKLYFERWFFWEATK
jgi:SAM-dependent methyltransferase